MGAIFDGLMFVVNFFGGPSTFAVLFAIAMAALAVAVVRFYKQATHQSIPPSTTECPSAVLMAGIVPESSDRGTVCGDSC